MYSGRQLTTGCMISRFQRFAMSGNLSATMKESMAKNPLPWWLFGCAGMVATTLTVGAAASLTRSGASMLYWKPHSMLPPTTETEWNEEFETYREFAHHHQRKPMASAGTDLCTTLWMLLLMSVFVVKNLDDFKRNFTWEYAHRLLGQGTALAFAGPLAYFYTKGKLPTSTHAKLGMVLTLGAIQMYVGRKMVRSNLEDRHRSQEPGFYATFGLPAHVGFHCPKGRYPRILPRILSMLICACAS